MPAPASRQLRLLLWKDYLTRKRKLVTLGGALWATAVMLSIYIVRVNVDSPDYPTCQFPARALPSSGMLPFLQSFICSVNNECQTLDKFDEIPTYENAKLSQLQRRFSPLLNNETVLDVAASVPDALKLLSKLADIFDESTLVGYSQRGLKLEDVFINPKRVKRYLSKRLRLRDDVTDSLMTSQLSFQGIFRISSNRCNMETLSETLTMDNKEHLEILAQKLCSLTEDDVFKILGDLMLQINFNKFIKMLGNMYEKLSGDGRMVELADTVTAVLRASRLQHFLPKELSVLIGGDELDFSYFDLSLIQKFVKLFEPVFGETESFKSIKTVSDTMVQSLQYLNKLWTKNVTNNSSDADGKAVPVNTALDNAAEVFKMDSSLDVFNILSHVTTLIHKTLPDTLKHDVLLYSTLLTKLIEGANKVIGVNMNIEQRAYDVTLRHPKAVSILVNLPSAIVAKGFEAMVDADRTQIMTAKITEPGQMFCDLKRLQGFFKIGKDEASSLKGQLCSDAWKSYVTDLIDTFGVHLVKNNINGMASLLIQETLGRDTSDQLYTIDHDFGVLKNFTSHLATLRSAEDAKVDWLGLFNVTEDSKFMKTVKKKSHLGKQMLVVIHGSLAKEVVRQNPILSYKISPGLIDTTDLVSAVNQQLESTPKSLVQEVKEMYPAILQTVVLTALDEDRTYKSLSTHSEDIMCNGVDNAAAYVVLPPEVDQDKLVATLCTISRAIESGLAKDSVFGKAIENIRKKRPMMLEEVKWTKLITGIKNLYVKLDTDYPYLFEYNSYGLSEKLRERIEKVSEDARRYWFGDGNLGKSVHLGLKFGFRLLDLVDREIFNVTGEGWGKMKYSLYVLTGPLTVVDDFIRTVSAIHHNESYESNLPPTTVEALENIVPNIPQLLADTVSIILRDETELEPIISLLNSDPPWPCSSSLATLLPLSEGGAAAVTGLETIWCMDNNFTDEWTVFLEERNVSMFDMKKWNTTSYPQHVFLQFSSAVDGIIDDGLMLRAIAEDIDKDPDGPWRRAWETVEEVFNRDDKDVVLKKFFNKLDTSLSSAPIPDSNSPLYTLWSDYLTCQVDCQIVARLAWKRSLQFVSVLADNVAGDLLLYFKEVHEPDANVLQLLGFTRNTTLYELYDKLPDYIGVLLHSYWDFGFMSQIRRAALTNFWDCEAVVEALVPPPHSWVDSAAILRVKPYICPSFLYWLSLPRGDNTMLDLVSKPQYYFYTISADNLTSNYEKAYTTVVELTNFLTNVSKENQTRITEEDIQMNSIQAKFEELVASVLNYRINVDDPSYRHFYQINKDYFAMSVYLTRIVSMVNKIATAANNLNPEDFADTEEVNRKIESDLTTFKKLFKRRPQDIIQFHFDLITDVVSTDNGNYSLSNAVERACNNLQINDTSKVILLESRRMKNQICAMRYKEIFESIENVIDNDLKDAKVSLINLVTVLQNDDNDGTDIFELIKERTELLSSLRISIKYSYDLGLPVYLQYLQSNLRHYDVICSFLAGGDWWVELRALYNGPSAIKFFDSAEMSLEIVEDVLNGLDRIHLVRLLHDINVNNSEAFCSPTIVLSDYLPDSTGRLSELKRDLCGEDKTNLFRELPPLLFASQGYDVDLKLPSTINYTTLNQVIYNTESSINSISTGPSEPQIPPWVTEDRLKRLREVAVKLLAKESLTRIAFGVIGNIADASTLFLNNSECTVCSSLTSWLKQLNLQIFKKQEYHNLVCRMKDMTLGEVHRALQTDFHWDMAVRELIQTRNYTKYELNKSLNEFLELVKLYILEDVIADSARLADCLNHNVSRNVVGNATLVINILTEVVRMLRAEVPHLHTIDGLADLPYFKLISSEISPKLDVYAPLHKYLKTGVNIKLEIPDDDILEADLNLRLVNHNLPVNSYVRLLKSSWDDICSQYNCSEISNVIEASINTSAVEKDLPTLQSQEFWRFTFVSNILRRVESVLRHAGRLVGVLSRVDIRELMEGRLAALLDFLLQVLMDDVTSDVVYSLYGLVEELAPLLDNTSLQQDMQALGAGVSIMHQFKKYLLEHDLKLEVSKVFSNPERVEAALGQLGINNTNFWSLAAPRLLAGHIDLKPLLSAKPDQHITDFICHLDGVSRVAVAGALDVVTAEDVAAAVVDQWCPLPDRTAKQALVVLLQNLNVTTVFEKVADILLPMLYASANLTDAEGALVIEKYPQMAALVPMVQDSVGDLSQTLGQEPLIQSLRSSGSLGQLLGSTEFLSNVGQMLCGKPFEIEQNRFYKAIAESKDFSSEPEQEQLDALPTDFCRDLYKEILSMSGGKIVWTFVKPLIMGKILYSPINPTVESIIEQANSTFSHMIKLVNLVHSFSSSFPSLDQLSQHREGVEALRRIISSPMMKDLRASLIGDAQLPDVDISGDFDEFGDLQSIGSVLKKGSDLLRCVNLHRFRAVADEYQLTHEAALLNRVNEFSAGLVFVNSDKSDYLKNVEYIIRMDIDNVPTTARLKNFLWIPGPESSFIEHMRYFRGFIQIQDLVDTAIIELSRSNSSRRKRETEIEDRWTVYTQQEPYPCYRKDFFQTSLYESQALMVALLFSLLFSVASCVRFIVGDRESGNTLLMSVMGVDLSHHTLSWYLCSLCELCAAALCVTAVLCGGGVLPRTDVSLVLFLLLLFVCSVLSFCYMISKLFSSASLAAVCAPIAYLMTFMPFVLILSLEAVIGSALKLVVCLSMSTSVCYAFLNITRAEARGTGAGWAQLWDHTDGDLSIGVAALMTVFDSFLYFAVGYLLDRLFGPKSLRSKITQCTSSDEKAGVSIINVTKIYGKGKGRQKTALDNVSIELYKGQVTTLLGHNGAGKTTLVNILTGMAKPTSGSVIVHAGRGLSDVGAGVCPQRDVLLESLTATEHVSLYAQLKSGLPREQLQQEIDEMMGVLSLGAVSREPVSRLSGGTRRRLCVALAFVGKPHLVSLDEPTAGVDPAHRRDIWSMIVKLREDRTVLLTTHHLDEAELLSDQIIIMHKGQVHTSGSPIDIKRSLGDGYKLSVLYPKVPEPWPEEAPSMNERTKQLLTVVRGSVKNASLSDVNGLEIEVGLPFFDANGLNNNFLQLCSSLEQRQLELGYRSYSLDCATLEQVFFNITQQADTPTPDIIRYDGEDEPSKNASTPSVRSEQCLVPADGPLRASAWRQGLALLRARYTHYSRNTWLLFLLFVLPSVFVAAAMAFSLIRPPPDNEVALRLHPDLYKGSTQYLVSNPSIYSESDPMFAERVLQMLMLYKQIRNWSENDTPNCSCTESKQVCEGSEAIRSNIESEPSMMILPDVDTLNQWIVSTHHNYIEKRYGGYSAAIKNNMTYLVAWYNNKGHHAMPAVLNELHSAALKVYTGDRDAAITVRSHPLKISQEQLSKDTVYQHVADAGISALVLIAYCLVGAGGAAALVTSRRSQQKRLQLLCGVTPALYWGTTLAGDLIVIVINIVITAIVFEVFGFPVFVARSNLPAICLLILLYGYACGSMTHLLEKVFMEASLANMVLFCGYALAGLAGITVLLILDIISDSEETDNVRWVLHKILLLLPQFVLGDGMLEIAKNTIQAQVLERFGMDTYKDPLSSSLLSLHYVALSAVGTALLLLNLAIEYDCFEGLMAMFRSESIPETSGEMEDMDVAAERKRVLSELRGDNQPLRLSTLGNINAGFVDTEVKNNSIKRYVCTSMDVAQCVRLGKAYPLLGGSRVAVKSLTLGLPPSQCTALLGENGAGKSTTFAMLTGEVRPTTGQIYLNGEPVTPRQLCRGLISYCPQSDAIDFLMTVRETLEFYCKLRGIEDYDEVITRTLEMFDLSRYSAARSGELSGGNKRKLCAAIAFMGRSPLVLLDEPTSGMDPGGRARVRRGAAAARAGGRAVLLSTHALGDARRLAARVALMRAGQLCALASLDHCLRRFGGGYVVACRCLTALTRAEGGGGDESGGGGGARAVWRRVRLAVPQARLRVLHQSALHFLIPTTATVDKKVVNLNVSDIFRLMAQLQTECDIEDYTLNQSSLDQMFLSFTDKGDDIEPTDIDPLPTIISQQNSELETITSL